MHNLQSRKTHRIRPRIRSLQAIMYFDLVVVALSRRLAPPSTVDRVRQRKDRAGSFQPMLSNRQLVFLVLMMYAIPTVFAEWAGDSTIQTGVGVASTSDGIFVVGRPDLITSSFRDYFRAALSSVRSAEIISIDIDYCSARPVVFCTPPQTGPKPTELEKEILGNSQFMTVGYAGAYRHSDGWVRRCSTGWCHTDQPDLFDTSLGELLFEVDYWLKTWAIGKEPTSGTTLHEDVPWLKPLKEYIVDAVVSTPQYTSGTARLWFEVLDSFAYVERDSKGIWFAPVRISLCAETDSVSEDECTTTDPAVTAFADALNAQGRLSELALTYPVIARLEAASHAVVAAKWIAAQSDLSSTIDATPMRIGPAPTRVKMRLADSSRVNLRFPGGVKMDPSIQTIFVRSEDDDGTFAAIAEAIAQRPADESMWTAILAHTETTVQVVRIGAQQ